MRHSVTTPGGFFIGLGGIATSILVAFAVYTVVRRPASSDELLPQQIGLGLTAAKDAKQDAAEKIQIDREALLESAAARYNAGKKPNINNLDDLRGVIRHREARKSEDEARKVLSAPSNQDGKTVIEASMEAVVTDIKAKKPAASTVKVDINAPTQKFMPPPLPNFSSGGVQNVVFPELKPAAPAAPAAAPAPTPGASAAPAPSPSAPALALEPNRPPLLNGNEPTK